MSISRRISFKNNSNAANPLSISDDFDEWLARIVCYAFSLPPTAFTREVNRATAETTQDAALTEGLSIIRSRSMEIEVSRILGVSWVRMTPSKG